MTELGALKPTPRAACYKFPSQMLLCAVLIRRSVVSATYASCSWGNNGHRKTSAAVLWKGRTKLYLCIYLVLRHLRLYGEICLSFSEKAREGARGRISSCILFWSDLVWQLPVTVLVEVRVLVMLVMLVVLVMLVLRSLSWAAPTDCSGHQAGLGLQTATFPSFGAFAALRSIFFCWCVPAHLQGRGKGDHSWGHLVACAGFIPPLLLREGNGGERKGASLKPKAINQTSEQNQFRACLPMGMRISCSTLFSRSCSATWRCPGPAVRIWPPAVQGRAPEGTTSTGRSPGGSWKCHGLQGSGLFISLNLIFQG